MKNNNPNDINKLYEQVRNREITEELFCTELDSFQCYQAHYVKCAYFYHTRKDISKAKEEIDRAIYILNSKDKEYINSILLKNIESKVYFLAGQIYANLGELKESLDFYIKSQYYAILLKSDFENDNFGIVYSFRSISTYSLSDLISKSITVCHPSLMNDPFDSLFTLWSKKENLNKICSISKAHIDPYSKSFQFFKIRSFVGNKQLKSDINIVKKIVMWSHYADEHRGFCIKYRLSNKFIKKERNEECSHRYLKMIQYQPKNKKILIENPNSNTDELFAYKSHEWKYENEIKLISYDASCEKDYQQITLDNDSSIEAIYFGYRCPENSIRDIMRIVGSNTQYYKMEYNSLNIYKLEIIKKEYESPS